MYNFVWSLILDNHGQHPRNALKENKGGQFQKAVAADWQWVPTCKEAVPPPLPSGVATS